MKKMFIKNQIARILFYLDNLPISHEKVFTVL